MTSNAKQNEVLDTLVEAILARMESRGLVVTADTVQSTVEAVDVAMHSPKGKGSKSSQKQRSTARKPKATQSAPDGFEVEGQFVYTKGDGSKSIWTITSIEDAAVMAHRQGTTKSRPWKFTSLAAMLQTGNVSLDLSEVVSKPKGSRKRKAA